MLAAGLLESLPHLLEGDRLLMAPALHQLPKCRARLKQQVFPLHALDTNHQRHRIPVAQDNHLLLLRRLKGGSWSLGLARVQ